MVEEKKNVVVKDFEDILDHVGGWSRYQAILLLTSLPFSMIMAYVVYTPVLYLYTPEFRCADRSGMPGNIPNYLVIALSTSK